MRHALQSSLVALLAAGSALVLATQPAAAAHRTCPPSGDAERAIGCALLGRAASRPCGA